MAAPALLGIGAVIAWIGRIIIPMLPSIFGSLVVQVLMMLGFSFIAVESINVGFDFFVSYIDSSLNGAPSDIVGVLGLMGFDEAVNVVLTAHLFVFGLKGLTAKKYIPSWRGIGK